MNNNFTEDNCVSIYDQEWIELMETAREYGLSTADIRQFLRHAGEKEKSVSVSVR